MSLVAALLAMSTIVPAVSAFEPGEQAFVAPCFDIGQFGGTWMAEPGQPIRFTCGWGATTKGGLLSFLTADTRSFTVQDKDGNTVLAVGPADGVPGWGLPQRGPSDDGSGVTCASPFGWSVGWNHVSEDGLPEGVYTVTWTETLRHPVNDGFHTCSFEGVRLVPAPSKAPAGSLDVVTTLVVAPPE